MVRWIFGEAMRNKASTGVFLKAYNLARAARVLDVPWFRRGFLSSYFLYKRWYEDPFWGLVRRSPELFRGGDVLDIGANIGYTAWLFARAIAPPAKVYAFEPDGESFATLREIVRRKKLQDRVEIFNLAVGAADGSVEFWHNEEHSADHRVATQQFKTSGLSREGAEVSTVSMTSVDSFVRKHNLQNVAFIKIDVQGYELAVCEGTRETLAKFPNAAVCFEYSPEAMRQLGFDPAQLLHFFRYAGYHLHILTRSATQFSENDTAIEAATSATGYVDVLCLRRSLR
jgi:FkbM family methyltransferase